MKKLITTPVGRLRLIGFAEGTSLLFLVVIAVPLKYISHDATIVKALGPVHGALFLLFIFNVLSVAVQQGWEFTTTTYKVLLGSLVPFGTFYIDHKILKAIS